MLPNPLQAGKKCGFIRLHFTSTHQDPNTSKVALVTCYCCQKKRHALDITGHKRFVANHATETSSKLPNEPWPGSAVLRAVRQEDVLWLPKRLELQSTTETVVDQTCQLSKFQITMHHRRVHAMQVADGIGHFAKVP